jgi:hypothetical protein
MALRPLNSIAGFSTGDPAVTVVQANGDITTINFTANGISNLGNVGNVKITGGNADQYLRTDGTGNLTWDDVGNISSNRVAVMPYLIPNGESYILNNNFQGLYSQPITIDGELTVDGMLIEIQDSIQSSPTQVLFDTNGTATGNNGFTFLNYNGNLNVPGNINVTGSVIPGADDTYDLGRANARWRNGYFGGNTIYLDGSSIKVDANGYIVITNSVGGSFTVEGTTPSATNEIENGNSNVTVYANSNIAFTVSGTSNVLVVTTAGANLTGNLTTGGVKTDNLYYANGTVWNFGQDPGGSNTQIQFNNNGNFDASANLTFNNSTNNLTVTGNLVTNTGALYGNAAGLTNIPGANITGNITGNISNAQHAVTSNTVVDSSQPNITNVGTLTNLAVSGNAVIGGNLTVNGNLIYVNVEELSIKDPIINLNTGSNGAAPVSNSGKDVGSALNYYDTQARIAFMGWDTSNAEFAFGSQTSISSEVVTFTQYGNVRASTYLGNIDGGTGSFSGNVSAGNANLGNVVTANYLVSSLGCVAVGTGFIAVSAGTGGIFNSSVNDINLGLAANVTIGSTTGNVTARGNLIANSFTTTGNISANLVTGTLTTATQPNITSLGTLGNLTISGNTVSNIVDTNTTQTQSIVSKRSNVAVTTLTVIDSFAANAYRTAKYVVSSQNDDGFESLEVLLIHNDINSYITVYGAINDGGGNTVTMSTGINSGNVELRATGLAGNTVVKLIGTYVPD